ncbi:hypothetical protein J3D55_001323 [Chryseobacterium ginsenosidimutans]|jgi:hypothetical protein|uniref:bacteriocin-like protein n=1 Tax=Chryseobacterium ginsenosidimutans TaxID=687846 RepID=UPI00216A279D|nr:hypothetical protein [Chryseobacterium ginsenosidimutans]MCS3868407.1 hypothetical protein [Chryseobacterium ginsenosidimutans]
MKNLKKISREQLKEVIGGALPGMKRCYDETTCQVTIYYALSVINSPCATDLPVCLPPQP